MPCCWNRKACIDSLHFWHSLYHVYIPSLNPHRSYYRSVYMDTAFDILIDLKFPHSTFCIDEALSRCREMLRIHKAMPKSSILRNSRGWRFQFKYAFCVSLSCTRRRVWARKGGVSGYAGDGNWSLVLWQLVPPFSDFCISACPF